MENYHTVPDERHFFRVPFATTLMSRISDPRASLTLWRMPGLRKDMDFLLPLRGRKDERKVGLWGSYLHVLWSVLYAAHLCFGFSVR